MTEIFVCCSRSALNYSKHTMTFLWSMRNRKKPCKTLVYGLLFGAFLTLQPKARQKSLILLVIVMSQFLSIQTLMYHTRAAGVCTSPKISFGAWEERTSPSLSRAWEEALVFSQGLLWGSGCTASRVLTAERLKAAEVPASGSSGVQGWQEEGHWAVPSVGCSAPVPCTARASWLAGDARSLVRFWFWEAELQRGFNVQLLGQIVFKRSHKVFVSFI